MNQRKYTDLLSTSKNKVHVYMATHPHIQKHVDIKYFLMMLGNYNKHEYLSSISSPHQLSLIILPGVN